MVIYALKSFHVIVPEPAVYRQPNGTFVDGLIAAFEHAQEHWLEDLMSSLAVRARRFVGHRRPRARPPPRDGRDDAAGAVLAVGFVVAGTLGVAAQVLYLGATEAPPTRVLRLRVPGGGAREPGNGPDRVEESCSG